MVASDPAFAKVDVDALTIGGEVRIRYEIRNNAAFSSNVNANESAASHRVRVNVGYDLTPDVSFFAQLQDARIWGNETTGNTGGINGVSSANNNTTGVDLHQGYLQLKNVLVPGLSIKAGRQEIFFGDHRLFGNFNWSQVGNSFDAVRLTHSMPIADVDVFWARIAETENGGGCVQGATGSCSGVIFPSGALGGTKGTTGQDIYGLYVTLKPIPSWTIEPYWFLLQDTRVQGTTGLTTAQASSQTRNTAGARINGKAGGLDATLEAAWQFGSISDNLAGTSPSRNLHVNAHAEALRVGYTFDPVPMRPRLGVEIDYASGDSCGGGTAGAAGAACAAVGHYNTFDNLFPTNHFKFGAVDLMAWKNQVTYQAVFDVKPDAVSKFQVNFLILRLARHNDNWYRSSQAVYGQTGAGNTSSSLGRELDVHYYRTFKEKFKAEIGVGHFWAGSYMNSSNGNAINGGVAGATNGSGENWGYVMGSVLF
jgi:hypothetical protein